MIRRNFLRGLISLGLGISGCSSNRDKPVLENIVLEEQGIEFPASEYDFVSQIPLFKVEEQRIEFPDVSDQFKEENYKKNKMRWLTEGLVLIDIPSSKRIVITPNENLLSEQIYSLNIYFVNNDKSILLTTNKGDVLFDINDGRVRFYHPNHFIMGITPNLGDLVVFEKPQEYNKQGSFSHYSFVTQRKKHMFNEDYAFDFWEFKNNVAHNHGEIKLYMDPRGKFFIYSYYPTIEIENSFSAPVSDRMAGWAYYMHTKTHEMTAVKGYNVSHYDKVYYLK